MLVQSPRLVTLIRAGAGNRRVPHHDIAGAPPGWAEVLEGSTNLTSGHRCEAVGGIVRHREQHIFVIL